MDLSNLRPAKAYGFAMGELETIINHKLSIQINELSFISKDADIVELSPEVLPLLSNDEFIGVMKTLSSPDIKIPFYKGGGGQNPERFTVYGKKSNSNTSIVSIHAGKDAIIVYSFENIESFCVWFSQRYASSTVESVANLLKQKMSIEEFVCILHLIDCYKRVSMCAMLDYIKLSDEYINAVDYAITLQNATKQKDTRWLMPTFFELTQDFYKNKLDITKTHLASAIAQELVTEIKDGENIIYKYSVYGRVLGVEFDKTWAYGVGFKIISDKKKSGGYFLAPTSMANHIFTLENSEVSHNVYTQSGLANFMYEAINNI